MSNCLSPASILLPADGISQEKWAVIACDQFTSQPEYWESVEKIVGEEPSTLRLICPEVYLERENQGERIEDIHNAMIQYMEDGILVEGVENGYILCERKIGNNTRIGLMAKLDLECYDYRPGYEAIVRATEETVRSRIPARLMVREGATLEAPHALVLINDKEKQIIEELYAERENYRKVYDTELMLGGGHLTGYAIEGAVAEEITSQFAYQESLCGGIFLAVGDGNHSLAVAKENWEKIKIQEGYENDSLPEHPARYALVEVENLYDTAIVFEPIHRVLFNLNTEEFVKEFIDWGKKNEYVLYPIEKQDCPAIQYTFYNGTVKYNLGVDDTYGQVEVSILQKFIDKYMKDHKEVTIDYIHGEDVVNRLVEEQGATGILLKAMDKERLFPIIETIGVLPRKTFSMGEAEEKRYYMECREI